MSEILISQEGQQQRHEQCMIQIPLREGPQTTNCQCPCHSATPATFVGETQSVEDKKII
jgi:hypothetical protein